MANLLTRQDMLAALAAQLEDNVGQRLSLALCNGLVAMVERDLVQREAMAAAQPEAQPQAAAPEASA